MPSRVLVALAIAAAILIAMRNWRLAVKAALVLVVIEGALRKWVVPGAQDLAYFAKDLVLVGAYIGFFRDRGRAQYAGPALPVLNLLLSAGALFGVLEIFNPELPTPLIGLLGWKAYFLYVPLLWVLPATFRSDNELWGFLRRYTWLAIPIGFLGVLQFRAPIDSSLNAYARGGADSDIAVFGDQSHARVTGTFSYISGYSMYLQATAILLLALLATRNWRLKQDRALFVSLATTLLALFTTGSRGPVLMMALLVPVFLGLSLLGNKGGSSAIARIAGGAAVLAVLVGLVGDEAITAFKERAEASTDVGGRIIEPFVSPWRVIGDVGALGFGIGATHTAAVSLGGNAVLRLQMRMPQVEAESGRVMTEIGALGFLLIYLPRIYLIGYAARRVLSMHTTFHRALAASSLMFLATQIAGSVVFEVTTGLYYWFFAGLLMLVVRLDSQIPVPMPSEEAQRRSVLRPQRTPA